MAYVARKPDDDQFRSESQNLQAQNRAQQGQVEKRQDGGTAPAGAESASNKAPGDFTKSNFSNATDILNRNKNADISSVTKRLLGNTERNAQSQNQQIADTVNKYKTDTTAAIQNQYRAPTQEEIDKALSGDASAESKVSGRLGMQASTVDPLDIGKRYEVAPTDFFKQNDYQPLLQQRSKGGYTGGMAALDSSLFNRSGGAQDVRNKVADLQKQIDVSRENVSGTTGEMQNYANTYEADQEKMLRDILSGKTNSINQNVSNSVAEKNKAQADYVAQQKQMYDQKKRSAVDESRKKFNEQLDFLNSLYKDQNNKVSVPYDELRQNQENYYNSQLGNQDAFLNIRNPEFTNSDVVSAQDANAYNKINSWLGSTDSLSPSYADKSASVSFDENAFNKWLSGGDSAKTIQRLIDQNAAKTKDGQEFFYQGG